MNEKRIQERAVYLINVWGPRAVELAELSIRRCERTGKAADAAFFQAVKGEVQRRQS
jgi:hypothetical protein